MWVGACGQVQAVEKLLPLMGNPGRVPGSIWLQSKTGGLSEPAFSCVETGMEISGSESVSERMVMPRLPELCSKHLSGSARYC